MAGATPRSSPFLPNGTNGEVAGSQSQTEGFLPRRLTPPPAAFGVCHLPIWLRKMERI